MKNNNITITTELTNLDIDLTKKYIKVQPTIIYNNNTYKSNLDNNFIQLNVISAGITNIQLYNSQRYVDTQQLKGCFKFSSNIAQNQIYLIVDSYVFNSDNKILVDSRENVILNISAYVNHDNNSYFLNSTSCLINSYEIKSQFYQNNNIILPLEKVINMDLNKYIQNSINTFPNDIIQSYITVNVDSNSVITPIQYTINQNILSGNFNNIYKAGLYQNYWLNNNMKQCIIQMNLHHYYKNKQLDKSYQISNGYLSCYIIAAQPKTDIIWINTSQIQKLYYDYNYKNPVFNDSIKYYGAENFVCENKIKSLSAYIYNQDQKQYIVSQPTLNSNKFIINLQNNCSNTNISNYQIPIYVYTQSSIYNKDIYFIASENNKIKISDFIISYPNKGLTDKFYINNKQASEIIPDKNEAKTYVIQNWKQNIYGNTILAGSGIINTNPLNVYNTYIPKVIHYNQKILLSGLYTDNQYIYHGQNIQFDKNILNITTNVQKNNSNYYLNLYVKNKKKLLNSAQLAIIDQIYYNKQTQKQILSSVIYNLTVYGQLSNFAKKTYTLLSKNNILSGEYLKRCRNKNIIDCCSSQIHLEIPQNMAYMSDNVEFSWINYNQFTNVIDGHVQTYQQMQDFIKLNKKKQFKYNFINIDTNQQISYELTNRDLFKFPGIRQYQLLFNNNFIDSVTSMEDIYNKTFSLSGDVNYLNIDNNEIKFKTYYLDLSFNNEIYIQQQLNYINNKLIKQQISSLISQLNQDYNVSGSFFSYNANTNNIKLSISQYGRYQTVLNIYPKDIVYNEDDIFQNYQKCLLTYDLTPTESYLIQQQSISGIYYNSTVYKNYSKIQIDKSVFSYAQIDINKIFSETSHIILDEIKTNKQTENINIKNSNTIILNQEVENQLPIRIYIKTNTNITAILDLQTK